MHPCQLPKPIWFQTAYAFCDRTSQGPGSGPLQKHIKASATAHGFFGNYESAVQQQQVTHPCNVNMLLPFRPTFSLDS